MPKNLGTAQEVSSSADPALGVARRFPPPWSVEERAAAMWCATARGQAFAYVYYESEPGR
jgi:hypothetical protein